MTTLEIIQKRLNSLNSDFKDLVRYYLNYCEYHIGNQVPFLSEEEIRKAILQEGRNLSHVLVEGREKEFLLDFLKELENA